MNFDHDSNARNSVKMLSLRMEYGMEGYGIYFAVLEHLSLAENYTLERNYNAIAYDLQVNAAMIRSVVEDFGLFTLTDTEFFSEEFSQQMMDRVSNEEKLRERAKKGAQARWGKEDSTEGKYTKIVEAWNSLGLTKIIGIRSGSTRAKLLNARIGEYDEEKILDAIEEVRKSSFLKGQSKNGWTADFDWVIKPNNFQKVLEGRYRDKEFNPTPKNDSDVDLYADLYSPIAEDTEI